MAVPPPFKASLRVVVALRKGGCTCLRGESSARGDAGADLSRRGFCGDLAGFDDDDECTCSEK